MAKDIREEFDRWEKTTLQKTLSRAKERGAFLQNNLRNRN